MAQLCEYGCGQIARYQFKNGKWCCSSYYTKCPSVKHKIGIKTSARIKTEIENGSYSGGFTSYNRQHKNPNRCILKGYGPHGKGHIAWNKGLTKHTSEKLKKIGMTISQMCKEGKINNGHSMSNEAREKISAYQSNKLLDHENGFPHVKYYTVSNIDNQEFKVRGKWELNVAKTLNDLRIRWIKPTGIPFVYDYTRHYIPDFKLIDTNEYIEVKGYYSQWDHIKLKCILEQYKNIRIYFLNENRYLSFIKGNLLLNDSILLKLSDCQYV